MSDMLALLCYTTGSDTVNIYLFKKYWSKHIQRLFSLILSIIMLTSTAVFSVLNERSELRRRLHNLYKINGNYSIAVLNVTESQENKISQLPYLDRIGKISSVGNFEISGESYTIGCFENKEAEHMYHTPILRGKLPDKTGQVAIPEFILDQISPNSDIGDQITLNYKNSNGESFSVSFTISGIIDNYMNRLDMEYTCMSDGLTITSNETEYPEPSVFIYPDQNNTRNYINLLLSTDDSIYFSDSYNNFQSECIEELYKITNANNIVSGNQRFILDSMSDMENTSDGLLQTQKTDDIKIINLITILMMIVAAMSMFSGIISIIPQRIESLRLLRTIGLSKKKLINIFLTESLIFLITGTVLGIALACGLHEILLYVQKIIGLSAFRGYTAEYIIELKTKSPFIFPVILSAGIVLVSLIIPVKNIISMSFYKNTNKSKYHRALYSLNSAYSKITGAWIVYFMSAVSTIIVIFSTVSGYCYYSQSDKGTSFFSIGNPNTEASYYLVNGINMKENEIDCFVSSKIPTGNTLAVFEKKYGISGKEERTLRNNADVLAWGSYPAYTVVYDKSESPGKLSQSIVPVNPDWEYYYLFDEKRIYDLPLILLNENMMRMLCDASKDDVILLSQNEIFAYETGENISMITCFCDENTHMLPDTLKYIDVTVTKQLNLNKYRTYENNILQSCSALNFPNQYGIVMTADKAEQLGFYNPDYSSVLLKFNDKSDDTEMNNYILSCVNKPVRITTINELTHNAKLKKMSSNANPFILFILLFILNVISLYNLMQMNISNNIKNFSIMHSLGMPLKRIKKLFISHILITSAVAVIIGVTISLAGQHYIGSRYDIYTDLLSKQQELAGNDVYPEVIIGFSPAEFDETDPLYELTIQLDNIKSKYMLDKELWLPDLHLPLLVICAIIFIISIFCSLITAKIIKTERKCNDD